jgi:hypothetical protein
LVVETDGLRYHRTPSAQTRDARRDRPRHGGNDPTPLHPLRGSLRTKPRSGRAHQDDRPTQTPHPTLTTPDWGQCRMRVRPPLRRKPRPCIRRRPRAWRRRPRRSRLRL